MRTCSLEFFKIYGPKSQNGFLVFLGCMQIGLYLAKLSAQFWMVQPCLSTRAENLMYMLYISIPSKCIISAKIEHHKFRTYLLNLSFFKPLHLMKINSTESYDFFLARIYQARIQLILTNTRDIQYSP